MILHVCTALQPYYINTRVPKNTYPVRTEHAISEYYTCSNTAALQLLHGVLHSTHLSILSSLTEVDSEIPLHTCSCIIIVA